MKSVYFVFSALKRWLRKTFPASHLAYYVWKKPVKSWEVVESRSIINKFEKRFFSQQGEDGILEYVLDVLGIEAGSFLEFGFSVNQCNCLNLMLNKNFDGVFIDANSKSVNLFNKASELRKFKSRAINSFLNKDTLFKLVNENIKDPIDVLSIDVDGNDYWFWKVLDNLSPAVVVIEHNASLGPNKSITVPYDPEFDRIKKHYSGLYAGASLTAMQKLGNQKGYALVGCDSWGVNAFFVRKDLLKDPIKELAPFEAFYPHKNRLLRGYDQEKQWSEIQHLPYEDV